VRTVCVVACLPACLPARRHRCLRACRYQFVLNNTALPNVNEWPLRLPMTKSAVKGFDTITEFMAKRGSSISSFYVVRVLAS
jgi:hypothetical protein